ncbi:MAG: NAD(P)H-hydrate epimerase [Candidatus Omnitrophica bacterium]|nr:NAD(P)H-hydrate epimerase [Candidatus Omnitrophota bacterium]
MSISENAVLTKREILEIERETEEKYGISRLVLMENAGRMTAEIIKSRFGKTGNLKVCVVSGKGNNGGDGFVAARYLFNAGCGVKVVYIAPPEQFTKLSFTNYEILCKMKVDAFLFGGSDFKTGFLKEADVVIDAVFGTGLKGRITGVPAQAVSAVNGSGRFVVCADIPSGLDADEGVIFGDAVKGNLTVSFGFAKKGFYINRGPEYCGEIVVADIGFPGFLKKRVING